MRGFLQQLAGMAIGDPAPGSAVPDLPPRFGARLAVEETNQSPAAAPAVAGLGGTPPCEAGDRDAAPVLSKPARLPRAAGREEQASASVSKPAGADPAATAAWSSISPYEVENRTAAGVSRAPARGAVVRDAEPPDQGAAPAQAPARAQAKPAAPLGADMVTPPAAQRSPLMRTQAPLSDAALTARAAPAREPTVIQVTIDRLEVRAPTTQSPAPTTATQPRPRPQPSVSLSDYLGASRGGGPA